MNETFNALVIYPFILLFIAHAFYRVASLSSDANAKPRYKSFLDFILQVIGIRKVLITKPPQLTEL